MDIDGQVYDRHDFGLLLIRKSYNERTEGESHVVRAYLLAHIREYDRLVFGKRLGHGIDPDPTHLPAVQENTVFSTKLRVDILGWRGSQPVLIEVKQRITPATLGQILTYRHHFIEENPDAPEPELVVAGREGSADAITALQAHSVTVYLYPDAGVTSDGASDRV